LITMSWGSDLLRDADSSSWMRRVTRYTLRKTSVLVGDCQAVSAKAQELGMDKERIVLFPWGVDLQLFSPREEKEFRNRQEWQDAFILLSTRSWENVYGVDVLVTAFARAAQEIAELRLILLGGGSQSARLHGIINHYGVQDRIYFGGQVKNADLAQFYRSANLYLSASHSDGSSVSLMEALACGKAVLVSDIPGNMEWITPGQQGWVFPDGDVDALEKGIVEAFEQRNDLQEIEKKARLLAEERADWSKNFKKLLQAYDLGRKLVERRTR
jgi:L-malate glycosyltransferase